MKLYKKIIVSAMSIFFILILILFVLSSKILPINFIKIENENINENIKIVKNKFDERLSKLDSLALEYAMWDDTYEFIKNPNQHYVKSNFSSLSTLKEFESNFIIFCDNTKKVKISKWFDLDNEIEEKANLDIQKYLVERINNKRIKGIIRTKKGPIFVASESITNTNGDKSSRGIVIVGRYLDKNQISEFAHQLRLNITYGIYEKDIMNKNNITWNGNIGIQNISNKQKQGILILKDVDNKPYLNIKILMERKIYNEFKNSINYVLIIFIIVSMCFTMIFFYEIYQLITKRIANISKIANKISKTKELCFTLDEKGNDEITTLNKSFNTMIRTLQNYREFIVSNEKKYHLLFSNMTNGFCYNRIIVDENGKVINFVILEVNNEFKNIFNVTSEEVIENEATYFFKDEPNYLMLIRKIVEITFNKSKKNFETIYFEKIKKWILVSAYSIEDKHFAIMFKDITEKKQAEQKIIELAYYDSLTGIPNRKMLTESIEAVIANKNKNAIFFIDLDDFKKINDTLGHNVGDIILQKVSYRLKNVISKIDIIGRLGGDEFIVLQKNIDSIQDVKKLALKIIDILKVPIKWENEELYIGASIGISIDPDDGSDVSTLMKNADIAMYEAKKRRNHSYQIYSNNINNKSIDKLVLETNLYKSIINKELIVFYQPIVEISKMQIIGFEALVRWKHKGKLVFPSDFIPISEETGFIIQLGEWVLRESCKQWKKWYDKNKCIYISVNITFKQIESPNFIETVISAVEDAKMDYSYLILEITENGTMKNIQLAINVLNKLKSLGIKISLDDFGTGYSSLSHVNKLPIDILKIDRTLTVDIESKNENFEIVKSIIGMSHSLNIKVIIEGVETNEQLNVLKELKCDSVQGYLISKPIPVEKIENSDLNKMMKNKEENK